MKAKVKGTDIKSHYALFMLYVICLLSYVDRQVIALVAPQLQAELGLADWQLGFVSGTSFAFFYVLMGLPLSRLADRTHRVRLLSICIAGWSLMTAACGLAMSFVQLALARVGVAVGEAGGYPTSLSLIGDLYPPERRALVTSILLSATTAGALVALIVGGMLAESLGWRMTFIVAACPGFLLAALLLLTVREPVRGRLDGHEAPEVDSKQASTREALGVLFRKPLFATAAVALALANIQLFALVVFAPTYALRTFALGLADVGLGLGLATGLLAGPAMIAFGRLSDRIGAGRRSAAVWLAASGQVLGAAGLAVALSASDFTVFCVAYGLSYGALASAAPVLIAATQNEVVAGMRATAAAVLVMISTLVGYGLGPMLIGGLSDVMPGDPTQSLRQALMVGLGFTALAALILIRFARVHTSANASEPAC